MTILKIPKLTYAFIFGIMAATAISYSFFPNDWRALSSLVIIAITIPVWFWFIPKLQYKLERVFLLLSIPILALLIIAMPITASVSWDGQIHFDASRAIIHPTESTYTRADALMANADSIYELGLYPYGVTDDDWTPNWNTILSQEAYERSVSVLEDSSKVVSANILPANTKINGSGIWSANVFGRIPNAIGLGIGEIFSLPSIPTYYLGRISGAAVYVLIMYLAIRNLKYGKLLPILVGMMPTTLFMAANYTYDPTSIALITYGTTRYIGILQDEKTKFDLRNALLILLPFTLGIFVKAILFPAFIIFFTIPKSRFDSKKSRLIWNISICLLILITVSTFLQPFLTSSGEAFNDSRGGDNINSMSQIAYILKHPFAYCSSLIRWIVSYASPSNTLEVPLNFCYLSRPFGWQLISAVEWVLLITAAFATKSKVEIAIYDTKFKIIVGCALLSAYILMATSMYLGFTPVGGYSINGMQPRYLLVLLYPILALTACSRHVISWLCKIDISSIAINKWSIASICFISIYMIIFGFIIHF